MWTEPAKMAGDWQEQYVLHVRNFLDCVKSRNKPIADVESGHQVVTACHLSNISLRLGRKIHWDAKKEEIVGDAAAAAMLVRDYRSPWDEALANLKVT